MSKNNQRTFRQAAQRQKINRLNELDALPTDPLRQAALGTDAKDNAAGDKIDVGPHVPDESNLKQKIVKFLNDWGVIFGAFTAVLATLFTVFVWFNSIKNELDKTKDNVGDHKERIGRLEIDEKNLEIRHAVTEAEVNHLKTGQESLMLDVKDLDKRAGGQLQTNYPLSAREKPHK